MKTQPKGPWLGVNNRLPDFALHQDKVGDFLRAADNVDIDNSGNLLRRKATSLVQAMTGAHSLYLTSDTAGYLVRDSVMYSIGLPTYTETLYKVLTSNQPLSYLEFAGSIYYSNGTDSGRITAGTWFPMALPTPTAPTTSTIAGSLPAGTYQVAVAYANTTTGEEGGVSASTNPTLASTGGLHIPLPAATPGATHINVYISTTNGSIPMLHSTVAAGTATIDLTTLATGRESNQRYEAPLPAGTQLFLFNGCLCSVNGANVYEGSPFRPGYYLPSEGRVPFPDTVSNAVPAQNGIYIVADKTYWIPGTRITTAEGAIQDVLPYGGVPNTSFVSPNKTKVGWFGDQGIVLAGINGEVEAVMSDNIELTPPASGLSIVFNTRVRRVFSCGWTLNLDTKAATTYSGYGFTAASRGYGTMTDGLYLLEAASGAVTARINLGKENFGTENLKHMPCVYAGYASDSPLMLEIGMDGATYEYSARSYSEKVQIHRFDTGRGLRANWYDLTMYNVDGADFTLASVSFAPIASVRRI